MACLPPSASRMPRRAPAARTATRARKRRWPRSRWPISWRNWLEEPGMKHRKDGIDPVARSRARRRALQAIYAWQVSGGTTQQIIAQFAHEQAHEVADLEYFEDLVRGVMTHVAELDGALAEFVDREVEQIDQIERAALRIATYELRHRIDVPYRVVINEAIDSTKRFGSEHGHTYVNGVLDHAAAAWRAPEFGAARPR